VDKGEPANKLDRFKDVLRKNHIIKVFQEHWELGMFVAADLARVNLRAGLSDARPSAGGPTESAVPRETKNMTIAKASTPTNLKQWNQERYSIYNKNKDLFLHYDLEASNVTGQKYDVTIYLIRQSDPKIGRQRDDLQDVERVEFFFGPTLGQ
jgi:hypothetical protein